MSSILEKKDLKDSVQASSLILIVEKQGDFITNHNFEFTYKDKIKGKTKKTNYGYNQNHFIIKEILFAKKSIMNVGISKASSGPLQVAVNDSISVCQSDTQMHLTMTKIHLESDIHPMPTVHGLADAVDPQKNQRMILFIASYSEKFTSYTATYGLGVVSESKKDSIVKMIDMHKKGQLKSSDGNTSGN